jgi:hypothetical protein
MLVQKERVAQEGQVVEELMRYELEDWPEEVGDIPQKESSSRTGKKRL